jgi:hypothetical protein
LSVPSQVKGIAHAHHGTVNDVLAAAVAGGLRALLASRGEPVDGLVLRAFVPVSLHREQPGQARRNLDGAMIVPLPIGEADPVHRLGLIAAETAQRKKKNRPAAGTLFRTAVIQRAFLRYAGRQRFMNVYIANVPGPPGPAVSGPSPAGRGVPRGADHGKRPARHRRPVLRRAIQHHRGCRPERSDAARERSTSAAPNTMTDGSPTAPHRPGPHTLL